LAAGGFMLSQTIEARMGPPKLGTQCTGSQRRCDPEML
jgi:hypothetical protein